MPKTVDMNKVRIQKMIESSIHTTFSNFFHFDPKLTSVEKGSVATADYKHRSISGVMALVDGGIQGTFSVGLSKEAALKLLSKFYGEELTSLDDKRVIEGVAEIANVAHGILKEQLNKKGFHFRMCLPLVVVGSNHTAFVEADSPTLTLKFQSQVGEIVAEVILHTGAKSKRKSA